eukprot:s3230_g5.t1
MLLKWRLRVASALLLGNLLHGQDLGHSHHATGAVGGFLSMTMNILGMTIMQVMSCTPRMSIMAMMITEATMLGTLGTLVTLGTLGAATDDLEAGYHSPLQTRTLAEAWAESAWNAKKSGRRSAQSQYVQPRMQIKRDLEPWFPKTSGYSVFQYSLLFETMYLCS